MTSRTIRTSVAAVATAALVGGGVMLVGGEPAHAAQTISNIAYAPAQPANSQGHLLDLYLPSASAPTPLLIWTSGSAWMSDTGKSGASALASTFNAKGWAVAGVSVRSASQAQFPGQIYDIKSATRWLRANASKYNLDPNRFAVAGDSSGGWTAAMATVTNGVASLEGDLGTTGVSSDIQVGLDLFGPIDLLQMQKMALPGSGFDHDGPSSPGSQLVGCQIQTCPDKVRLTNPLTYLDANDPPLMIMHGTNDMVVPPGQSPLIYDAYKAKCLNAQFFSVPGAGHGWSDVMSASRQSQITVKTTKGCQETVSNGTPTASWDTVIAFFEASFKGGPTPTTTSPTPTVTTTEPTPTTSTPTTTTKSPKPTTTKKPPTKKVKTIKKCKTGKNGKKTCKTITRGK
ncbi:MAG: alpha/beta hydrolase [Kineosporiaceae bacterium]